MSRKKQHIDKLFKEGLKNFSLLVTDKDLDAIDDKASVFKDQSGEFKNKGFEDFELEITDLDWQATKAKLDSEKQLLVSDSSVGGAFDNFEIQPHASDWTITYDKYKAAKRKRIALWWWLSTGMVILTVGLSVYLSQTGDQQNPQVSVATPNTTEQAEASSIKPEQTLVPASETQDQQMNDHPQSSTPKPATAQASGHSAEFTNTPYKHGTSSRNSGKITELDQNNSKSVQEPTQQDPSKNVAKTIENTSGNSEKPGYLQPQQSNDPVESSKPESGNPVNPESGIVPENNPVTTASVLADPVNEIPKPKDTTVKNPEPPKPHYGAPSGFYIGMVNQVANTSRYLAHSNNELYNSIRKASDKSFIQYFVGMELGYMKNKNRLSIGVNSTRQVWTSQYKYSYKVYDSLPYRNTQGDTTGYFMINPRDTFINETRVIRINRIEVPFEYTRSFKLSERLGLNTGFGAVFGFNTSVSGDKILYSQNRYLYKYNVWKSAERSFSFAPSLSVGVQYRLSSQWMLQSSVFGNMYAASRFKTNFSSKDYPYSVGLNIKLIYLLNKQTRIK